MNFQEAVKKLARQTHKENHSFTRSGDNYYIEFVSGEVDFIRPLQHVGVLAYQHDNRQISFVTTYRDTETVGRHSYREKVRENTHVEVRFYHLFVSENLRTWDHNMIVAAMETIKDTHPDEKGYRHGYRTQPLPDAIEAYLEDEIEKYTYLPDSPVIGTHAGYSTPGDTHETIVGGDGKWEPDHPDWPEGWIPASASSDDLDQKETDEEFYHRGRAYESEYGSDSDISADSMLNRESE